MSAGAEDASILSSYLYYKMGDAIAVILDMEISGGRAGWISTLAEVANLYRRGECVRSVIGKLHISEPKFVKFISEENDIAS